MKSAISERGIAQWLARLLWEQKVAGSTPAAPTSFNLKIVFVTRTAIP